MTKRSATTPVPRSSTHVQAQIREFANSSSPHDVSKQRAVLLLDDKNILSDVVGLGPEDQTKFLDKVDQLFRTLDVQAARHIVVLGRVCGVTGRLPTSLTLIRGLEKLGTIAVASGGLTDIWRGNLDHTQVAIKAFRIYPPQNLREAKMILWPRVVMWKRLSHPNILPFRGVNMSLFQLSLVYDWGANGNVAQYVNSNPRASRLSLLLDIAKGLEYLHSVDIPHGDLKGANVVIDRRGRARLTEYGLAPIISDPNFTAAATPGSIGTSRWLSPEIIAPARKGTTMPVMETKAADVFAFGMLAIEVFTGKIPFEEQKNEAVVLRISRGGRPGMPENAQEVGLTPEVWNLLENCWHQNPKKRPMIQDVVRRLQRWIGNGDVSPEVPPSPEEPVESAPRRRVKTEAIPNQTRLKVETNRSRTMSDAVPSRTKRDANPRRPVSAFVKQEVGLEPIAQSPISEVSHRSPRYSRPEAIELRPGPGPTKQETRVLNTPPRSAKPFWKIFFCGLL